MIYEVRTYQLKPRSIPEFLDTFGKALPIREKVSKLGGFFYTDIGPLNQVIHLWPYKSLAEREKKRAAFTTGEYSGWPPKVGHLIDTMTSEIFIPSPFTPTMAKGNLGPVFEWREYATLPGMMDEVYRNWESKIAKRLELSPLVVAMHSEIGGLSKFVHVWAYESLDHRAEIRAQAVAKGIWPPKGRKETLVSQSSKIVLAAPFSPIK
jgi:truncated hemoglobin YjbI